MIEHWKAVRGCSNYEVSSLGRVRSLHHNPPKILKPYKSGIYLGVTIYKDEGEMLRPNIHRLIAETMIPKVGRIVRHLNDDRTDNRIANLAWGTYSQNSQDALRNGVHPVGRQMPHAKLDDDKVRSIRNSTETVSALARRYGVARSAIQRARDRITWRHVE